MKRLSIVFLCTALVLTLHSCIQNDLPYPVLKGVITALDVPGAEEVSIDEAGRTVLVRLPESADPANVTIRSASFLYDDTRSEPEIVGSHDLSSPLHVTLKTYQDYPWTITAVQEIQRFFTVGGQVGTSVIDAPNRRVIAYVSKMADISDVTVTSLKLAPDAVYDPPMADLHDFSEGIAVKVTWRGRTEIWNLYVERTERSVDIRLIDPWTGRARVVADGTAGTESGFRYRKEGDSEWTEVLPTQQDGGTFSTFLEDLEPQTRYECKAFCGEEESELYLFDTEDEKQVPNRGFEAFSNAESKNFQSWYDPASSEPDLKEKWWDSGNVGSTTIGSSYSISLPDLENRREGRSSARLVSRYVVVKFAAGNVFTGEFVRIVGTQGGIINFGRPWTHRPKALRLWVKYECGTVDVVDGFPADDPVVKGDPDRCFLMMALGDWDYRKFGGSSASPVQINTTDKSSLFNKDNSAVIAYNEFCASTSSDAWAGMPEVLSVDEEGWAQLEIPFVYQDETRKPTHIILSFAASKLGDYFTGSSESRLWVDDLTLVY